jgi:Heme/copper-type cytochrome/quinol oxidases, subunit 2
MKKWLIFASVLTLALVIAACGSNSGGKGEQDGSAVDATANAGGEEGSGIVISASDWEFDQEQYTIKAGEAVNVTLKSVDGVHGISILKTDYDIKDGKTVSVQIDEPGTYDIICNVPCGRGHRLMKAQLVVQ